MPRRIVAGRAYYGQGEKEAFLLLTGFLKRHPEHRLVAIDVSDDVSGCIHSFDANA